MPSYRLNARKPLNNSGLPTAKRGELYLLYKEDIISMPLVTEKGVVCAGDFHLKNGRRFHILYLTPSTQKRNSKIDGEVDSRGFKKKVVGNYPGDEIEIHEFIKNNVNQGFVIIMNSYDKVYHRIYGSFDNPLYFTGDFNDDDSSKGWELTFEQNFADGDPVLFYNGQIIIDENALEEPEISDGKNYAYGGILKPEDDIDVKPGLKKWFWAGPGVYDKAGDITIEKLGIISFDGFNWDHLEVESPGEGGGPISVTFEMILDVFQKASDDQKTALREALGINGSFNEASGFNLTLID